MVVWLVVVIQMMGEAPVTLTDQVEPDLMTCWISAQHAMDRATEIKGHFEFQATCSIVKMDDPA
jgi:hypothetical protein